MNDQYRKLGKNTLLMMLGNFASRFLVFLLVPLYTRCLDTGAYGTADLLTTTISLLSPVLTIAASEGILRFTLNEKHDKKQVFTLSVFIFAAGFALLACASPLIALYSIFGGYTWLFLVYYFSYVLLLLLQQFVKGLNDVKSYAISGFLSSVVCVASNILLLAVFGMGVQGYILAMIAGSLIPVIYLFFKVKMWKYLTNPFRIAGDLVKRYLIYCWPLVMNQLSWWINNSSDKYILTYFCGLSANGVYSVAYKIPSFITAISGILYSAWQISSVDDFGSEKSVKFFSDVYRKYTSVFLVSASGLILFIRILAKIFFANDFSGAWQFAVILIIAAVIQALGSFMGTVYTAAMKPVMIFVTTLLGASLNTVLNFILIPRFAAYGAAIATVAGYSLILIIRLIDSRRILPMKFKVVRDIICFALLGLQAVVTCLEPDLWYVYSALACLAVAFLNLEIVKDGFRLLSAGKKNGKNY